MSALLSGGKEIGYGGAVTHYTPYKKKNGSKK